MVTQLKNSNFDIGGITAKSDDRYTVKDNNNLNNLVLSSTRLYPNKSTTGHSHEGQEEVYIFISGGGTMEVGSQKFKVCDGDTVLIPSGEFHRVHAGENGTYFICVFEGSRDH